MRYSEIIGEAGDGDTWAIRFATHQKRQAKRTKLRAKLHTAQDTAARQRRQAADRQAAANDRLADIQRDLANPNP